MVFVPRKPNSQPQGVARLDIGNPLARGIVSWQTGVNLNGFSEANSPHLSSIVPTTAGVARNYLYDSLNATGPYQTQTIRTLGPAVTLVSLVRLSATADLSNSFGFISTIRPANVDNFSVYIIGNGTAFNWVFEVGQAPSTYRNIQSATTVDNEWHLVVARQTTTTSRDLWVDGVNLGSNTLSANPGSVTAAYIGSYFNGIYPFDGDIALSLIYNRALNNAEIAQISRNPWQIFAAQSTPPWIDVVSGGQTLTGNDVRQDTTSTSAAVTQDHALSGNNVRQDTLSTSAAVTQDHALSGNDVRQDTTSTSAAVTQDHALIGNDVRQDNTSTTGTLVQAHNLIGNNVRQDNTSITGTVGQTHALTGNDVRQNNTSTTGAVASDGALIGQNVRQDNTSTTGAVGQTHALAGNSVRQDNTSTSASVIQDHALAGNSVRQDTTSTSAAVDLAYVLTGNSVRQDTTSNTGTVGQTHILTGANAAQPTTSSSASIAGDNDLTGNSVRQDTTASTGTVGQTHILVGNSVRQNTTSTTGAIAIGHVLVGAPVAVDHVATSSQIVQAHILAGNSARQNTTASSGMVVLYSPADFTSISILDSTFVAKGLPRALMAKALRGDLRARPAARNWRTRA